ncbi:hypothetical protein KGF56_000628 [Candida oxycetoniae]|uniref:Uncharacterized protein n=1 Tax=Candida oxycetoniae TaxID=497107 RepID=A0AAI9T1F7_9ASCO|nr:uncharacterized protein KGF56_000628 [Candida oxycetoniae]KAI3406496.2 hypothetical protein KGF56_000628 [Candida oxycetoniae]
MTLTKYQRGDAIDGWNDCPTPVMSSQNSSQQSLGKESIRHNQDREGILNLCELVFKKPMDLPERELTCYKSKLQTQIQTMNEEHLDFIESIFNEILEANINKNKVSHRVLEYMMVYEGVTKWCAPLKKIVNSV